MTRDPRFGRSSLLLVVLAAGCGSQGPKADGSAGDGSGGARDAPTEVSEAGVPDASTETGVPDAPTEVAEGGADGGQCLRTNLGATIAVRPSSGGIVSCADASDGGATPRTWIGQVTASDESSLTLAPCGAGTSLDSDAGSSDAAVDGGSADAGCVQGAIQIEAHAPGLDLTHFPHVWVRVEAQVKLFYKCQQSLEITTATPFDGSTPQGGAGRLLLAVVDGGDTFADSPYKVSHVPLGCPQVRSCGLGMTDSEYAFEFSSASSGGAATRVLMGETVTWTSDGTPFTAHNLRSFSSGNCDDYWDWAYTLTTDPT